MLALCTASFSAKGSVIIPHSVSVRAVWCWHLATIAVFINRSVRMTEAHFFLFEVPSEYFYKIFIVVPCNIRLFHRRMQYIYRVSREECARLRENVS